jgi:primosomal protein N''
MNNVDLDLDAQINGLELEWRLAYDATIVARTEYQQLAAKSASVEAQDLARERLEQAEARKARVMTRIERLEYRLIERQS